jgi:hypothetical protein
MSTQDYKVRHGMAYSMPTNDREAWIVDLIKGIEASVQGYERANTDAFPDGVISEYFGQVIQGARGLLNADFGTRLDAGTLDAKLCDLGEIVRYDLDLDEVRWEQTS